MDDLIEFIEDDAGFHNTDISIAAQFSGEIVQEESLAVQVEAYTD